MRIITFAETTQALLAGRKTVTRREWKDSYAATFKRGELLQAWDKNPRTRQGKKVAIIRLAAVPEHQRARDIPDEDWDAEGFGYMADRGLTLFGGMTPYAVYVAWQMADSSELLWVVRFELVEVL